MKRFLYFCSIIGFTLSQETVWKVDASQNITDFQVKGKAAILGLQDYVFNLETNINTIDGAKKSLLSLKNLEYQL